MGRDARHTFVADDSKQTTADGWPGQEPECANIDASFALACPTIQYNRSLSALGPLVLGWLHGAARAQASRTFLAPPFMWMNDHNTLLFPILVILRCYAYQVYLEESGPKSRILSH